MDEKTWTIVQFIDYLTVEAVPSTWIQGHFCHWPTLAPQKLNMAIRKWEPLNTCWPVHKVKIFRNATYDDYTKAREKPRIAEETSDLCFDVGDIENKKRKRVQKTLSSSEGSFEESELPDPPPLKRPTDGNSKGTSSLQKPNNMDPHYVIRESVHGASSLLPISSLNEHDGTNKMYSPKLTDGAPSGCSENINSKNIRTIMQQNLILRELVCDCLKEIRSLKLEVLQNGRNDASAKELTFFIQAGITFPINSDSEIDLLEDNLVTHQDIFQCGVKELSKLGGNTSYQFVQRSMKTLMEDELVLKYSWLGRKGKRAFKNMQIARLVICAAEKANIPGNQMDHEKSIQLFLKRAFDRIKRKH